MFAPQAHHQAREVECARVDEFIVSPLFEYCCSSTTLRSRCLAEATPTWWAVLPTTPWSLASWPRHHQRALPSTMKRYKCISGVVWQYSTRGVLDAGEIGHALLTRCSPPAQLAARQPGVRVAFTKRKGKSLVATKVRNGISWACSGTDRDLCPRLWNLMPYCRLPPSTPPPGLCPGRLDPC